MLQMKAITQYINESWTDGQLDKSVKTEKNSFFISYLALPMPMILWLNHYKT